MKKLITILLLLLVLKVQSQTANAGSDVIIYLTQTSTATLNGNSSSGTSYQWSDITSNIVNPILTDEAHPANTGTITSPTSKTTTVTGLSQGTWYYQIAVTTGATTVRDTMVVRVDYDAPPANSTILTQAIWSDIALTANLRADTTTCFSWTSNIMAKGGTTPNQYNMEKDGSLGSYVDTMRGKYYSVISDGHGCSGYGRSEIIPTRSQERWLDTSKTYVVEWKGYFPQPVTNSSGYIVTGQIHGNDANSPPFAFRASNGNYIFEDGTDGGNGGGGTKTVLSTLADMYAKTHTTRLTIKEGVAGTGFIKIEFDGVQKYYRNTGKVGATLMRDWFKGATMYESSNLIIDPTNTTRGKRFALVTESYKIYTLPNIIDNNIPPTCYAGANKTIVLPTNSVTLTGTGNDVDGTITSWAWTKEVGGSATITTPSASSTTITGLTAGEYRFKLTVTDNGGATATDTVHVTVNASANVPPTVNAGSDQTVTLPNDASLSGSATDSDGNIVSYSWTKVSGSDAFSITSPSLASTTITGLSAGVYVFRLTATDDGGATGYDDVQITVNASPIQQPYIQFKMPYKLN